jgi:hypothetical protein
MDYVEKSLGFNYQAAKRALRIYKRHDDLDDITDDNLDDALGYGREEEDEPQTVDMVQAAKVSRKGGPPKSNATVPRSSNGEQRQQTGRKATGPNLGGTEGEPVSEPIGTPQEPVTATDADMAAAAVFIEATGSGKQAACALVLKCASAGDKEPVKDILRAVVAAARSVLPWTEVQEAVLAAEMKANGAKVEQV